MKNFKRLSKIILLVITLAMLQTVSAQFNISSNQRYLLKDGKPFFWLGDTGWELFHRLTREEADQYLKRRSEQGFTVIQAVVLAEFDGLHTPNAYGNTPLMNDDPTKPNEAYFQHVDYIIDKAASYNLNIALLPTWGDKVFKNKWGTGPEIFNEQNAATYGNWIAKRYKNKTNIIWILGGDRYPRDEKDIAIWRAMALAIMKETNDKAIISYHSQPNLLGSAEWFRNEKWFSFNLFQTGHCRETAVYDRIQTSYNSQPVKPVIDGEPIYEDHPVCFNVKDLGTSSAYDVRKSAYLDMFAGAFGHTYGCHDIWQFYSPNRDAVNGPHVYWQQAMELPGANQMIYVRRLIESHPVLDRIPDQSLIKEDNYTPAERIQATRGNDYLFVYTAVGKPFTVVLEKIKGDKLQSYWFNPRNGKTTDAEIIDNKGIKNFTPPSSGYGQDWVLVLDDAGKQYPKL
jgi:Protein of unknown function (DUF4038)/Putative collagen-binding domain of a collagenase